MGWGTTAPSGVSWTNTKTTAERKDNDYTYWIESSIARGTNNTIYVRVKLYCSLYNYDNRLYAGNPDMRAYIAGAGNSGWAASNFYEISRPAFGATALIKTIYYTGTANYNAAVSVYGYNSRITTATNKHTAPQYTSKYTVTYNGNGSTGGSTSSGQHLYGSSVSIASCGFSKTGHHFVKWNTKADGTGTSYNPGSSWSGNSNMTLYAIWEINTYTITYKANGSGQSDQTQSKTYGTAVTLKSSSTFTWSGHQFNHWNTKADDSGTSYRASATFSGNANITLYAIWDGTWPVIYKGNGATGGSTASQTKIEDIPLDLQPNGFTRDKHAFVKWNTKADGTGTDYGPPYTYTANQALTLYAIWLKLNIPVFWKDSNGDIHQVEKAYYRDDNSVVKECTLFIKIDGTVYELS